jgi:phosphate-selective porin OprO/OprP
MKSRPALLASDRRFNLTRILVGIAACTLMMFHGSYASAQSTTDEQATDPFEDLRMRIEQLERDNRDLRTALAKRPDDSFVPLVTDYDIAALPPAPDEVDADKSPEDRKLESLVDGMIRRMNAQSKAASDAQDKKLAALESKLDGALKKNPKGANGAFGPTGLLFSSNDGNFKTHFGGTAQLDFIAPESTASGITTPGGAYANQDSTNFRRLRMRADGTMYGNIDWVSEFDFAGFVQNTANGVPGSSNLADNGLRSTGTLNGGQQGGNTMNVIQPTTVFMTFKEVPILQNIRVGNQQDWFSIEHITSARYLDFMERAPIMDVFSGPNNNGYTPGVSVFGNTADKMAGLQLGVYKNNAYDSGYTFSLGNAFTYGGRAIWTPYYDECSDGRYLVHTGFGTEFRTFDTDLAANQNGDNVRLRSRGDLRIVSATLTPNFADTGNFYATSQEMIDPEFAVVWGPLTVQAEYTAGWFNGARTAQLGTAGAQSIALGNCFMSGGYCEALYFLTGENKTYNRQTGLFGQVVPLKNFKPSECTYGAWQTGLRYDWMDMNSGLIVGGKNQDVTLGLNWFLNPNVRFQFNVVGTYINNGANTTITSTSVPPAAPNGSAATGAIQGSKFTGDGLIMTVGTRMDITF